MSDDLQAAVRGLYGAILAGWNAADAEAFAASFAADGEVVGFDGSEVIGRNKISEQMAAIFADHATGTYVGIVRQVRPLGRDAALLRGVSGVVPAGADDLDPALNAIQALVAQRGDDGWRAVLYQNTQAQFNGRPKLAEALTRDLRAVLKADPS